MTRHVVLGRHASRRGWLSFVFAVLFAPILVACWANEARAEKVRIVLVGDSTVTDQAGWGLAFAARLKPAVECVNMAKGGASSKSYYEGAYWKRALEQKPAYVIIQFGHNDQPGKGPSAKPIPKPPIAPTWENISTKLAKKAPSRFW